MSTQRVVEPQRASRVQHYGPLWHILIGLGLALVIGRLFFFAPILTTFSTPIVAIGLDPLTTVLRVALLLIPSAVLVSTLIS